MTTTDDRTVLADLGLSRGLTVQLTLLGTLGFAVSLAAFGGLYGAVTGAEATFGFALDTGWWNGALSVLVLLLLVTAILVPHELAHGLAIRHYGGKPHYGVGIAHFIMPYAYATTDHRFTRNQFLVVLLTPLVGLTVVGVALMLALGWPWLAVPLAANAGGAVVDLWMTATLLGYPASVIVEDHESGVRILGRPGDERPTAPAPAGVVWDALTAAAGATVALLVVLGALSPFVLSALGITSLTVGTPDTLWFLFSFSETPTEISYSVGPGAAVVGTALGLCYALLRAYLRPTRTG
jgi:hypothetical protein